MLRTLWVGLFTAIITFLLALPAMPLALMSPFGRPTYFIVILWSRLLLWASGVKVEVEGLERLKGKGSYLLMANHFSYFDIPALIVALPMPFRFIAKSSLFKIPFFGWSIKAAGYISIERGLTKKALLGLEEALKVLQKGVSVLLFPEGTRSHNGKLGPFKRGGFLMAFRAGVPLMPISIQGSYQVLPRNSNRIRPGTIRIVIGEPMTLPPYSSENIKETMSQVRQSIAEKLV